MRFLFLFPRTLCVLFFASTFGTLGWANTVRISGGARDCNGTFISPHALVTSAHCVDGLKNTDVTLPDGTRSTDVVVHDNFRFNRQDWDMGFVLFPLNRNFDYVATVTGKENPERSPAITVRTVRNGALRSFAETGVGDRPDAKGNFTYLDTTNRNNLADGDSGAGGLWQGRFLGPLRGCTGNSCGFFVINSTNGLQIYSLARARNAAAFQVGAAGNAAPRDGTYAAGASLPAGWRVVPSAVEGNMTLIGPTDPPTDFNPSRMTFRFLPNGRVQWIAR